MEKNKIVLIVPFYNCKEFLEGCVASILSQDYDNIRAVFIGDASSDGSSEALDQIKDDPRFVFIRNEQNLTALPNIHKAVMEFTEPNDIVALLDGDDRLLKTNSLSTLAKIYEDQDCWVSWSLAKWSDNSHPGIGSAYPTEREYKSQRQLPLRYSHLRSWRAALYTKRFAEQDPSFSGLKDKNNEFYRVTYDVAIFANLLNLTPYSKAYFAPVYLYWYNRGNPISDDKVRQKYQTDVHMEISRKPDLKQVDSYL